MSNWLSKLLRLDRGHSDDHGSEAATGSADETDEHGTTPPEGEDDEPTRHQEADREAATEKQPLTVGDWVGAMYERGDRAYETTREHLLDELYRLDFLLWVRVVRWRSETSHTPRESASYVISDATINQLLQPNPPPVPSQSGQRSGEGADGGTEHGQPDGATSSGPFSSAEMDPATADELLREHIDSRKSRSEVAGLDLRLTRLAERFDLDPSARDALLLAVAPELDPKYQSIYGYLNNNLLQRQPTVDIVVRTLSHSPEDRLQRRELFGRTEPLRRRRLLKLLGGDETPLPARSVRVDERMVSYLLGTDTTDPDESSGSDGTADDRLEGGVDERLEGIVDVRSPARRLETSPCWFDGSDGRPHDQAAASDTPRNRWINGLIVDADVSAQLERLTDWEADRGEPGADTPRWKMAHFYGPYGSCRSAAVAALCADRGRTLVTADVRGLVTNGVRESVEVLIREAQLRDAVLAVSNLESLGGSDGDDDGRGATADLTFLIRALDEFDDRVFLLGEDPLRSSQRLGATRHAFVTVQFPIPSYDRRQQLWREMDALPEGLDIADIAGKFRLTGGQIADALETARSRAYGTQPTVEDVYAGCRFQSREKLGSLGRVVDPTYEWADIVLPADEKRHLEEVAVHIAHQEQVYTDWGFEEKFSLGNGVIALFTGPSGTGKTMAAEVIANAVDLDLYKIDLSNVVSKYIGETEKNLSQVFDEAENSNAILFFDEADALFGKRSEVSDAHDRYANIEVNYLLQRVEEHDGAVILTTNFKRNIDEAFLRRIHLSVDFPRPDRAARERIWRGIFPVGKPPGEGSTSEEERAPVRTPVGGTPVGALDYEFLSTFELTGGNIKNIAVAAAFLAASGWQVGEKWGLRWAERQALREAVQGDVTNGESTFGFLNTVEMEHVVWATRRELQKNGKLIQPEQFGEYQGLLPADTR